MKKIGLIIFGLALTGGFAASDYFPLAQGNSWTFSYQSSSAAVVPNPLVTSDSGIVRWEITYGGMLPQIYVKQTRSLYRRTVTGGSLPGYDSVFSSPKITVDTLYFHQDYVRIDTLNPRADSIENAISFGGATCPVAVHDPAGSLPVELTVKDTFVPFLSSGLVAILGVKISSRSCSCDKGKLWTFVLGPDIGPVEAYIALCPGMVGAKYSETRKLISYAFPTSVINDKLRAARFPEMKIKSSATTITCSFGKAVQPVSIGLYSVSGKEVTRFTAGESGMFSADAGLVPSGCYVLLVRTAIGVFNKKIWLGR